MARIGEHLYISSSISNFSGGIIEKYHPTIGSLFFGMYHWLDYLKFFFSEKPRTIVWCGSDLLALNVIKAKIVKNARHITENTLEKNFLLKKGIHSEVRYNFLDNPDRYPVTYKYSNRPNVYITCHPGREEEYGGLTIAQLAKEMPEITFHIYGGSMEWWEGIQNEFEGVDNLIFHSQVPSEQFDKEINNYQAAIRCNIFDGFSETLAKSLLKGQYPISYISYPNVDNYKTIEHLKKHLKALKMKKKPNPMRNWWYKQMKQTL